MAGFFFNIGAEQLLAGTTVWSSAAIRARLVTVAAGAPDKDADVMTGIGSAQASATVVISTLTPLAATKSDARDRIEFTTTGNITFTAASAAIGACDRMVLYRFATDDAASIPLVCVEITAVTPNGGDVTVTMPTGATNGWFYTQQ